MQQPLVVNVGHQRVVCSRCGSLEKSTLIRKTKGVPCVMVCATMLTSKEPFEKKFCVCVCKLFAAAYGAQSVWAHRYAWTEKIGSKFYFQAKKKKRKKEKETFIWIYTVEISLKMKNTHTRKKETSAHSPASPQTLSDSSRRLCTSRLPCAGLPVSNSLFLPLHRPAR